MKCLSVSQPFADLIVRGRKDIELRSWNTNFRGQFLIHAPQKVRNNDAKRLQMNHTFVTGAIIGKAILYNVRKYDSTSECKVDYDRHFASGMLQKRYGFMLRDAAVFQVPIPWKGKLGFFEADLQDAKVSKAEIITDIIDEEYRYGLIGHH